MILARLHISEKFLFNLRWKMRQYYIEIPRLYDISKENEDLAVKIRKSISRARIQKLLDQAAPSFFHRYTQCPEPLFASLSTFFQATPYYRVIPLKKFASLLRTEGVPIGIAKRKSNLEINRRERTHYRYYILIRDLPMAWKVVQKRIRISL